MKKMYRNLLVAGIVVVGAGMLTAASRPDFILGRNLQILFNMFRDIDLLYVDSIGSDKLLEDAAAGMVSRLDPYTVFMPERVLADFKIQTTGKYGGIGSVIHAKDDYVVIAQPYHNFPADKAGLIIGDKIIKINGEDIKGFDVTKVSDLLKGTPGTSVKITVEKLLTGDRQEVSLTRERIAISGIPYYGVIGDNVGYIQHDEFSEDCSNDMRIAFEKMKKEGITSLIIDLRNNGGGILQEAVKIVSMFVPKGKEVVSMRGRFKTENATFKTQGEPRDTQIPIVVLVNSMTASAAEILSGSLQDLDRAVLVGQRTFGKGLVQTSRPLGFNTSLKITTAKYYIPSGRCIQAIDYTHRNEDGSVGLVPDSLIREYKTSAGRKVYDGGGVMPDVCIDPIYSNRFSLILYAKEYISEFANDFYKRHRDGIPLDNFQLSDSEYDRFVAFMEDKEVDFESETEKALDNLRKKAEREKYLDQINDQLKTIGDKLRDDKNADLLRYKEDIRDMIENEIIMRYHYYAGVSRHSALTDPIVKEAIAILKDQPRYQRILTSQDTARK